PLSPTVNHPAPCLRRRRPTHDPPATRESTGNPQVRALRQEREPSGAEWSADHAAGTPTEHNAHRTTPTEHGAGGPIGRRKWSHLRNPAMLGRRRSEPSSSKAPLAGGTSDLRSGGTRVDWKTLRQDSAATDVARAGDARPVVREADKWRRPVRRTVQHAGPRGNGGCRLRSSPI